MLSNLYHNLYLMYEILDQDDRDRKWLPDQSSYLMLLTQWENCKVNWVSYVKDILVRYGFGVNFGKPRWRR